MKPCIHPHRIHPHRVRLVLCSLTAALLLLVGSAPSAHAQANASASRDADLSVWAGFNYTVPDYGLPGQDNKGIAYGAHYQRNLHLYNIPVGVGIEARGTYTTGPAVGENTFSGGLRVATTAYRRFHPYGTLEFGHGNITYDHIYIAGYTHDDGTFVAPGGGMDIDVKRNFGLKVDFQEQLWTLGKNYTLTPASLSIGVVYRIPFGPRVSHGYERQ